MHPGKSGILQFPFEKELREPDISRAVATGENRT
jgi:hypothetical protein